jgi:hypothetical protein
MDHWMPKPVPSVEAGMLRQVERADPEIGA